MKPCPTLARIRAGVMKPCQLAGLARIRIGVMNVYVTEREGMNYTIYVRTQVYVQFVHLYSQKTS